MKRQQREDSFKKVYSNSLKKMINLKYLRNPFDQSRIDQIKQNMRNDRLKQMKVMDQQIVNMRNGKINYWSKIDEIMKNQTDIHQINKQKHRNGRFITQKGQQNPEENHQSNNQNQKKIRIKTQSSRQLISKYNTIVPKTDYLQMMRHYRYDSLKKLQLRVDTKKLKQIPNKKKRQMQIILKRYKQPK